MIPIYLLTYERPFYLFATLDALTKNTVYPFTIYVGTNDRSAQTREILDMFYERRQTLGGWCYLKGNDFRENRDRLIKKFSERTEYMVITDDDILPTKWWLTKLQALMEKYPQFGMIGTELDEIDLPDLNNPLTPKDRDPRMIWSERRRFDNELDEVDGIGGMIITRTKLYKKIGKFYRDHEYSINLQKEPYNKDETYKVGIAKNVVVRHLGQNAFYDYPYYSNAGKSIEK